MYRSKKSPWKSLRTSFRSWSPASCSWMSESCARSAAASVVGVTFDAAKAAPACGMTAIEFEEVCETLVRKEKLIARADLHTYPDGTVVREYVFKHPLCRRALYERQGPVRLADSHRVICETLEKLLPARTRQATALQLHRDVIRTLPFRLHSRHVLLQPIQPLPAYRALCRHPILGNDQRVRYELIASDPVFLV